MNDRRVHRETRYEINGEVYHSLDDVPEPYRALFEDRDGDGLPDIVDGMAGIDDIEIDERVVVRSVTRHVGGRPDTMHCVTCGFDLAGTAVGGAVYVLNHVL